MDHGAVLVDNLCAFTHWGALLWQQADTLAAHTGLAEVTKMTFMQFATLRLLGVDCYVSRSGYTGEDGFEISVPAANAACPLAGR